VIIFLGSFSWQSVLWELAMNLIRIAICLLVMVIHSYAVSLHKFQYIFDVVWYPKGFWTLY